MELASKRAHWAPIIESWKQSGKSQVSYCKENNISHSTFEYWKKRLVPQKQLFASIKVRAPERCESNFITIETSFGLKISILVGTCSEDLKSIFKSLGAPA
jgi:hypothetical protein